MIHKQKVLGLITARGGSKGLPGKNIKMANGKPLISWSIQAGLASKYVDRLILSSDDEDIMAVAKEWGCDVPFQRADYLSKDDTASIEVVFDALRQCPGYDWVVLLQPTSPLRTAEDIDAALERCMHLKAPACVSVCQAEYSPYWMYTQKENRLYPVVDLPLINRRQTLPPSYYLNGAIYVAKCEWLVKTNNFITTETVALEMPLMRSIDIDDEKDFQRFEALVL